MKFIAILSILLSFSAEAGLKEKLRNYTERFLGVETANKVFGKNEEKIKAIDLPSIPTHFKKKNYKALPKATSFDVLSDQDKRKYYINFVRELAYVTRGIRLDENEISKWVNVLEQGGSQEGVYRAMVLDKTYLNLESFKESLTPELIDFLKKFGIKFLSQTFKDESFQTLNVYSLKRIFTEKALELVDYLGQKPDELYRWYAVFSSDLALNLKSNNRVRTLKDAEFHYNWAKNVPWQHIKSEVIIKIHEVLNQLNAKEEDL